MPTPADVRKIALALEGVSEVDHWGRPSWRTTKRIFAVMRPDGLFLSLPEERKEFLFEADPKIFIKYMWGKTANVIVQIDRVSAKELKVLIGEAWTHNLPPPPKAKAAKKGPAVKKPATDADLRKFALALPGVEEKSHFGTPDFRYDGHIFAQMSDKKNEVILKLLPDHQEMLFEASPQAFRPEIWGKIRWTRAILSKISAEDLKPLVREAYDRVAAKPVKAKPTRTKARKKR
jgi:hypothetical protein